MPKLSPRLRRWLFNRYTAFLLFIAVFTTVEQLLGGLSSFVYHIPFEGPLLLYLYWLLNAIQRQDRWTPWLAGLPIVCLYGLYDGFFLGYGEVFRVVNFNELPELMQVLPLPPKTPLIGTLFAARHFGRVQLKPAAAVQLHPTAADPLRVAGVRPQPSRDRRAGQPRPRGPGFGGRP